MSFPAGFHLFESNSTVSPSKQPASSPTIIYGDAYNDWGLSSDSQKIVLLLVTLWIFCVMFTESWSDDETFFVAVMVITLLKIITLEEALLGPRCLIYISISIIISYLSYRILQSRYGNYWSIIYCCWCG
jgi:hypothetical protein